MSMKRTKQRGAGGREQDSDASFWKKPEAPELTWEQATEGKPDEAFAAYALTDRYTKGQLLVHPKFGRGLVVGVELVRIEILFQDGTKKLGHGQHA